MKKTLLSILVVILFTSIFAVQKGDIYLETGGSFGLCWNKNRGEDVIKSFDNFIRTLNYLADDAKVNGKADGKTAFNFGGKVGYALWDNPWYLTLEYQYYQRPIDFSYKLSFREFYTDFMLNECTTANYSQNFIAPGLILVPNDYLILSASIGMSFGQIKHDTKSKFTMSNTQGSDELVEREINIDKLKINIGMLFTAGYDIKINENHGFVVGAKYYYSSNKYKNKEKTPGSDPRLPDNYKFSTTTIGLFVNYHYIVNKFW